MWERVSGCQCQEGPGERGAKEGTVGARYLRQEGGTKMGSGADTREAEEAYAGSVPFPRGKKNSVTP